MNEDMARQRTTEMFTVKKYTQKNKATIEDICGL